MVEWVPAPTLEAVLAEFCARLQRLTAGTRGELPIALTGGESAAVFYDAWTRSGVSPQARFYWSDERLVPLISPDSNYKLAHNHLLAPAGVEKQNLFPMPTQLPGKECAAAYADEIRRTVDKAGAGTPVFPLVILGLGDDGHTGSLFPGRDPYEDNDLLVRAVEGTKAHPHPRVTFTPKLINAAREVWFIITGAKKAWAVEQLRARTANVVDIPSLAVNPNATRITMFAYTEI